MVMGPELACVPSFLSPIFFGMLKSYQFMSNNDSRPDPVKDPAPLRFSEPFLSG